MVYKTDKEIESVIRKFEDCSLPKAEWTHAAHLTVGLYYCFHNPFGIAKNVMTDGIYRLNDAHGTPNTETSGYHETLTVFWMKMLASFAETNKDEKNLRLLTNKMLGFYDDARLPFKYYTRERLFSVEARFNYIEPDLADFTETIDNPL
ncbi:MAG: hypothetical protein LUM44_16045 [Pyrinomonadaceae bacterium]|nr:hypothetical protein [Pyrinomonadaceae bacterium]